MSNALAEKWVEPHERMIALYLDDSGRSILLGNEIFGFKRLPDLPQICHKDIDNPIEDLAKAVKAGKRLELFSSPFRGLSFI